MPQVRVRFLHANLGGDDLAFLTSCTRNETGAPSSRSVQPAQVSAKNRLEPGAPCRAGQAGRLPLHELKLSESKECLQK